MLKYSLRNNVHNSFCTENALSSDIESVYCQYPTSAGSRSYLQVMLLTISEIYFKIGTYWNYWTLSTMGLKWLKGV